MNNYEKVKNDEEILSIYKRVNKYEIENKGWAFHDINHVLNVASTVESILKSLKYDDEFIDEAKVAALLHDTGCTEGKEGHPLRSYEFAKEYLARKNIELKNKDMVLDAILNHSNKFDTDNVIALVLILADKLDIKENRITEEGKKVIGNRQYQYINDIKLEILDNCLNINFICDNKIDIEEMQDFYFTKKVFKSIESFAEKNEFKSNISIIK